MRCFALIFAARNAVIFLKASYFLFKIILFCIGNAVFEEINIKRCAYRFDDNDGSSRCCGGRGLPFARKNGLYLGR